MRQRYWSVGLRLGHPVHPMLVHFPAALFPTSLLFDLLSAPLATEGLVKAAFSTMAVGEAAGFLAAVTGAVDYVTRVTPGTAAFRVATLHALLNVALLVLYGFNLGLRLGPGLAVSQAPQGGIALSVVGVLLLAVSNFLGGQLVYRYGIGVRANPPR